MTAADHDTRRKRRQKVRRARKVEALLTSPYPAMREELRANGWTRSWRRANKRTPFSHPADNPAEQWVSPDFSGHWQSGPTLSLKKAWEAHQLRTTHIRSELERDHG